MQEILTVAVAGKFGPKGEDGKWYGVKRPLKASDFKAGQQYEITTEDWASNGKSGVNIVSKHDLDKVNPKTIVKEVKETERKTIVLDAPISNPGLSYDDKKNARILRQGIVQAVVQSPSLAGLPFTSANDVVKYVKDVSEELIKFVENA